MDSFPSFYTQMAGIEAKVLKKDHSFLHHNTSEATGRIYAASVHEGAAKECHKPEKQKKINVWRSKEARIVGIIFSGQTRGTGTGPALLT